MCVRIILYQLLVAPIIIVLLCFAPNYENYVGDHL